MRKYFHKNLHHLWSKTGGGSKQAKDGQYDQKDKSKKPTRQTLYRSNRKEQNKLGISIGAPFIFKNEHIKEFKGNLINSHGAPLPSFKGGGGFSWRIMQKDKKGTILVHLISEGIDEGEIIFRHDFEFDAWLRRPIDYEKQQYLNEKQILIPWLIETIRKKNN